MGEVWEEVYGGGDVVNSVGLQCLSSHFQQLFSFRIFLSRISTCTKNRANRNYSFALLYPVYNEIWKNPGRRFTKSFLSFGISLGGFLYLLKFSFNLPHESIAQTTPFVIIPVPCLQKFPPCTRKKFNFVIHLPLFFALRPAISALIPARE